MNENNDRLNLFGNNWKELNDNRYSFGIALVPRQKMAKTYNNLYDKVCSLENLSLAWRKARKGKTSRTYVQDFERNLETNLIKLNFSLKKENYRPLPLKMFVIRDPKTRTIHKSDFRDRIVHHAVINILEPIFERIFIYDSYANRLNKGNLKALQRFNEFVRKVSRNGKINGWFSKSQIKGYCLKADIKKYFETINLGILLSLIQRKIKDEKLISLIKKIVANFSQKRERESNFRKS